MEIQDIAFLIITDNAQITEMIDEVLKTSNKLIYSKSVSDARVKKENQKFGCFIVDIDCIKDKALEFVQELHDSIKFKGVKDRAPILIIGGNTQENAGPFIAIDNVRYLEKPFTVDVLKNKLSFVCADKKKSSKKVKLVKKDEVLIEEGGKNHDMYWLVSGELLVYKNFEGKEIKIGQVQSGELVGEMSFLDNLPRSASVKALSDCEVLVIPNVSLLSILDAQPRWFVSIFKTLSKRLREVNQELVKSQKS